MLYISRQLGLNDFCVIDTEDGVEERVTRNQLRKYCFKDGIIIHGVSGVYGVDDRLTGINVVPYDIALVSRQMTKLSLLGGVKIETDGDIIYSISVNSDKLKAGTSIRLSDYGTFCSDTAFDQLVDKNYLRIGLVLVFDDFIKLSERSKEQLMRLVYSVHLDISSMKAFEIYQAISRYVDMGFRMRLLDIPGRFSTSINIVGQFALLASATLRMSPNRFVSVDVVSGAACGYVDLLLDASYNDDGECLWAVDLFLRDGVISGVNHNSLHWCQLYFRAFYDRNDEILQYYKQFCMNLRAVSHEFVKNSKVDRIMKRYHQDF